ncbi:transposase [Paenibacillus sp. KN14-4R]|uniref:transposase n=1 Tax=Paenibacillus sp. KN14-4R TaxID=3445773 RepID=UPI003FA0D40F
MVIAISLGALIVPFIMQMTARRYRFCRQLYAWLGFLFLWLVSIIAANGVYEVVRDQTVFMTNIHGLFLNPWFLISSAYTGMYALYLCMDQLFENRKSA